MKTKSLLLFLLCVHVNAPLFGSLARRSEEYQILSGGRNEHNFDSMTQSVDSEKAIRPSLPPLLHERVAGLPVVAKSQTSDETLEFVRYELYNLNCKKNAKQYYRVIFNLNARFIDGRNLIHIDKLNVITGWILNEYEYVEKLSGFLNISIHQLKCFALDIFVTRINCGCKESFEHLRDYMYYNSRSVVKRVATFQGSHVESETQDSSPKDIKFKILEICNQLMKEVVWKKQPNIDVEGLRRICCNEQNLSSKSKRFWNNTVKNSLWVDRKEFEDLPVCIRLLLTDEAGEADKLKRLEEFAGCTFKADERLPLNFSETLWSVLSREEE